jgi:F-type H+-transporting ATPase subunit epsilon
MPDEKLLDGYFDKVFVPGIEGNFEILEEHSPFITQIRPGTIIVTKEEETESFAVHDGFVTVEDNQILILCESCEPKNDIDLNRAIAAKDRAEKRISDVNNKNLDFRRAEAALHRALARINTLKN